MLAQTQLSRLCVARGTSESCALQLGQTTLCFLAKIGHEDVNKQATAMLLCVQLAIELCKDGSEQADATRAALHKYALPLWLAQPCRFTSSATCSMQGAAGSVLRRFALRDIRLESGPLGK